MDSTLKRNIEIAKAELDILSSRLSVRMQQAQQIADDLSVIIEKQVTLAEKLEEMYRG